MREDIGNVTLDELAHYGTKGMKWGVRRDRQIDNLNAVGSGSAGKLKTLATTSTQLSARNIKKSGGVRNAAKNKAEFLEKKKAKIQSGEATAKDVIQLYGSDILPGFAYKDTKRS